MDAHRYWKQQGRRVAWHYNFGWWLAAFLRFSAAVCVAFSCTLLFLRQTGISTPGAWIGFAAALALCALAAYVRTRRKFFTTADGLVRLDVQLGLHSRLAAAAAGVGEFPDAQKAGDGWCWHWRRMLLPVMGCALLVVAASLIPVGKAQSAAARMEPPSAWAQVESWVEQLDESGLVEPKAIEELREKLDALKDRPESEWYSQSALEAGDNLREQTADAIRALQRDLQNSSLALATADQFGDQMSPAEMKASQQALDKALQGLELGKMPLDGKMLAGLKKVDLSKIKTLTPKQLAEMQKRLKEGASVCKSCAGDALGDKFMLALLSQQGLPGVSRGPGTVPLNLNPRETELKTSTTAALPGADMERALPGDVVGLASGEHQVDRDAYHGLTSAGAVSSTGEGGEAVWRDTLTPGEREMLKRYFK